MLHVSTLRRPRIIPSQGHPSEEGVRRKGSDQGMSAADPEALSRDVAAPSHLRKRVRKGKLCSKDWKKVYSTGSETRGKETTQGVGRTTVATGTLKAATKVLD
ncbi:hypothetical protein Tco_0362054 [Tanacetum coccineum]